MAPAARLARVLRPGFPEPLARSRLRGTHGPTLEVMQFRVGANAPVENVRADQLELPPKCRLLTVARDDALAPHEQTVLRAGDTVSVLAPATVLPRLAVLFQAPGPAPAWEQVTHDFLISGDAFLRDLAALYGERALTAAEYPLTLADAMQAAFVRRRGRRQRRDRRPPPDCRAHGRAAHRAGWPVAAPHRRRYRHAALGRLAQAPVLVVMPFR